MQMSLTCRGCSAKRLLEVPSIPFNTGDLLPREWGEVSLCMKCRRPLLEILNEPEPEPEPKPPVGWAR